MKKYYYGAWQNFYDLNWPIRYFIELIVFLTLAFWALKLVKKIACVLQLKVVFVKIIVWLVTETAYLIGHHNEWVLNVDHYMTKWGNDVVNGTRSKKNPHLKRIAVVGVLVLYLLPVFVDLPVSKYFQEYYLVELTKVKMHFQKWENAMSEGCEEYPPLFVRKKDEAEVAQETVLEEEESISIQLNEQGESSCNIRQNPSIESEIIGEANDETEIVYQNEFEDDGERYWIKVYLPEADIEGWLSGILVDSEQLEQIISVD
ncbi:MAG: SH3 domain-containing protein [Lachnospiraceae bacterium]|nr:SH3 domain-containing protein [Lachnospiraceae bacterium]